MWKKKLACLGIIFTLTFSAAATAYGESSASVTMEGCGAYLFTWRPVDCGDGHSFAILAGGNSLQESNVVLIRGYDYAYTFDSSIPRPWGQVPDLVNVDGVWAIPDNWSVLPEGIQTTSRITLFTNNKLLPTNERYIDVVHLPDGVSPSELPPEVRKYLINVDGSDAGAYNGTITAGWEADENGNSMYIKADGTYITSSWLTVDEKSYYMDENGIMLTDTITPDGVYVNKKGERTNYIPGWTQDEKGWRYIQKNGYYAGATWIQGEDGKWYYMNIGTYMETDDVTPDGYYVDENGIWDGQPSTVNNAQNMGPGMSQNTESLADSQE